MPFGSLCVDRRGGLQPAAFHFQPLVAQHGLEGRKEGDHVPLRGRGSHEAHPPHFVRQRTKPAPDLDPEATEQRAPGSRVVGPVGDAHRVQGGQAFSLRHLHGQSHRLHPGDQSPVVPQMAREARLQPFLVDQPQGFPQGVDHVDGSRMVVLALSAPVVAHHREVQVPARNRRGAGVQGRKGALTERDGREAGRAREALLGATVHGIDPPGVRLHLHAAEGGHGVHQEEGACLAGDAGKVLEGLEYAGGGLGVHHCQDFKVSRTGCFLHVGRVKGPADVEKAAGSGDLKVLAVVHAETSTGVLQPLKDLSRIAREAGALFLVDTVTSLGGVEVQTDTWGIDAVYSGTQKCLSCPPGLAPISFGERALAALDARTTPVPSWYLGLSMVRDYWGAERKYHHTAPINMIYALREALRLIDEEGLEARFARHLRNHRALVAGVEAMGLTMQVPPGERLPTLNTVRIPDGADDAATRRALLRRFGIEIGGGLGALSDKVWRVGLMGASSTERHVITFLAALQTVLRDQGLKVQSGGLEAAAAVYAEAAERHKREELSQ